MWSWIAAVSSAVVRFTVLHPVATIVTGVVTIVAGAWIQEQEWTGHELVAGLLYGVGVGILKVGITSYATAKAWEALKGAWWKGLKYLVEAPEQSNYMKRLMRSISGY